jgi:hypothetical protein
MLGDIDWGRDGPRISQTPQQQGMRIEADDQFVCML